MMKHLYTFLGTILCAFCFFLSSTQAEVSLSVSQDFGSSLIAFELSGSSLSTECSLELFASGRVTRLQTLDEQDPFFTFSLEEANTTVQATGVARLRRKGSVRAFFRARRTCGGSAELSETVSLLLRTTTSRKGLRPRAWLNALATRLSRTQVTLQQIAATGTFTQPLDIQAAHDGSNRLFIAQQTGEIYALDLNDSSPTKELFVDLSSLITSGGERGLLGLAFHPDFSANGYFFVNYSEADSGDTVVARFMATNSTPPVDLNSSLEMLRVKQPATNHNGGQLAFGPDGFLYIALGDGGGAGDPFDNGQNIASLLGTMLRIDVDNTSSGKNYAIPSSNPFVGNTQSVPEEIYAWGLRNPWRYSFDPSSDLLLLADVGQGALEEVNIIRKRGNYGWNVMEGSQCYPPSETACDTRGLKKPIFEYGRDFGRSITGGFIYRGSNLPAFQGTYIFGDFISGRLGTVDYNGFILSGGELFDTDYLISSFGIDESGELYLADYSGGGIYRFSAS